MIEYIINIKQLSVGHNNMQFSLWFFILSKGLKGLTF